MKLKSMMIGLSLLVATSLSSCYVLEHNVGQGAQGTQQVIENQWYALWGPIPVGGPVDGAQMAGGATDYTIRTEWTALDVVINFFTSWVSFYRTTITVTK